MAKKYKFVRFVEPVDSNSLASMSTRELLKRLEELRALHECVEDADWSEDEIHFVTDKIAFKNTEMWKSAWFDVKKILETREHVPRGGKKRRQEAARLRKHR